MTTLPPGPDHSLSELVAARICHDLGSPVASLTALLPQVADPAAKEIVDETTQELRARLLLMGAVFGLPDELDWPGMARLLAGAPMAHRVAFSLPARAGSLAAGHARLALAAVLLAAESLPRGGTVHVSEPAPRMLALRPEGRDAAWPEALLELLAGGSMQSALAEGPRRVLVPWLVSLAAGERQELGLAMRTGGGLPALTITPCL